MKLDHSTLMSVSALLVCFAGCESQRVDVVDLNKVVDALVAVLDDGKLPKNAATKEEGEAVVTATGVDTDFGSAVETPTANVPTDSPKTDLPKLDTPTKVVQTIEVQPIEPEKQDPTKEAEFLKKYAAKLNEMKAMNNSHLGVSMTAGGEIVGFHDPNQNMVQDMGEAKEFTVTIDVANNRLVASDNHGYHRPHGYGFSPGGMMMGYMLGSMMGRQSNFYSGAMAPTKPTFTNTQMSPANYHQSAVNSVRTARTTSSSAARARTGSKGFSFGK